MAQSIEVKHDSKNHVYFESDSALYYLYRVSGSTVVESATDGIGFGFQYTDLKFVKQKVSGSFDKVGECITFTINW